MSVCVCVCVCVACSGNHLSFILCPTYILLYPQSERSERRDILWCFFPSFRPSVCPSVCEHSVFTCKYLENGL